MECLKRKSTSTTYLKAEDGPMKVLLENNMECAVCCEIPVPESVFSCPAEQCAAVLCGTCHSQLVIPTKCIICKSEGLYIEWKDMNIKFKKMISEYPVKCVYGDECGATHTYGHWDCSHIATMELRNVTKKYPFLKGHIDTINPPAPSTALESMWCDVLELVESKPAYMEGNIDQYALLLQNVQDWFKDFYKCTSVHTAYKWFVLFCNLTFYKQRAASECIWPALCIAMQIDNITLDDLWDLAFLRLLFNPEGYEGLTLKEEILKRFSDYQLNTNRKNMSFLDHERWRILDEWIYTRPDNETTNTADNWIHAISEDLYKRLPYVASVASMLLYADQPSKSRMTCTSRLAHTYLKNSTPASIALSPETTIALLALDIVGRDRTIIV